MTIQVPLNGGLDVRRVSPDWAARGDEHPAVVLKDLAGRRRPDGHLIVFANEKGGVGKSTLAFQCAVTLAHHGFRVVTVDCDRRQQSLNRFLDARDGAVRTLRVNLPRPKHVVLEAQSGAMLLQELDRVGKRCDFVIIDLAGHDSPVARRAIALADTVVTPVNCSLADLASLGSMHPISGRLRHAGPFAETVMGLREEQEKSGLGKFDWIVARNRVRRGERRLNAAADRTLATMSRHFGFRLVDALPERLGYRELLPFGLSQLDLKLLPRLLRPQTVAVREVLQFMHSLRLPKPAATPATGRVVPTAAVLTQTMDRYRDALRTSTAVPATVD